MANLAVRAVVRVKGIPMKVIIDIRVNVSIMILSVIKKLQITMGMPDGSKIIAINQTKKNIINIVRDTSLSIQDTRVSVSLLVIDIPEDNLLLETDWID